MEKSLDLASAGSLAQADVERFFDNLLVVRVLLWLLHQGADRKLLAAIGRHQLLPIVVVRVKGATANIPMRSSGGLTGSWLASLLARVPIESSFSELAHSLRHCAFPVNNVRLMVSSYVDNIYCASTSQSGAILNTEIIFAHLHRAYRQNLAAKLC